MIDRIQTWLDHHPRTRFASRSVAASAAALVYIGLFAFGFGILGVVGSGAIIVIVNVAGPIPFTSLDAVWGTWSSFLWTGAIVGAIAGLIRTLMRIVRTDPNERRDRAVIARDLIAQAVVAQQIGAEEIDLHLGILGGGDVRWSHRAAPKGGPSAVDQAFDQLTVHLANPSLARGDWLGLEQRRAWFEEISRTAEEIVIRRATTGATMIAAEALIASATQRAHTILDEVDEATVIAMSAELRTAGSIRNARLQTLMPPMAAVECVDAEVLL